VYSSTRTVDVPALAAAAIGGRLAQLNADATPNEIAELLVEGRDERLGVRWRLVDGDGRPILLDQAARRQGREQRTANTGQDAEQDPELRSAVSRVTHRRRCE
jgi:hypothetical protein